MAKTNPLDKYVTSQPSSFPRDFKVPTLPSLSNAMSGRSLKDAAAHFDAQNEQFRKTLELTISERIRQATPTTTTVTTQVVTPVASAPASSSSAPSVDLSSINAQIAALQAQLLAITSLPGTTLGTNNVIPHDGRTYDIPAGYSLVVSGPLIVNGSLTIEGILDCLP